MTSGPSPPAAPASLYPIVRLVAALLLMTLGGSAMYAAIVILKPIALEFGVSRGVASMPYMAFMLCFGLGGIAMGRLADRVGAVPPVLIAGLALPAGFFAASHAGSIWQLALALGLLAGLVGTSATFGPLVADISHWFERRRGLAVAVVISGTYLGGALWPPVLQYFIDGHGWRATFQGVAIFLLCAISPLALMLLRRPPISGGAEAGGGAADHARPLGFRPNGLQGLLCAAGIGCCAAMAMPQVHIVAYASDLGFAPARGAEMLSLMLACGIISRLVSGWLSDRVGGLSTLLLGSFLQMIALAAFLTADSLTALYLLSAGFGLSQGGIVPSYTMIVRRYFPPGDAGWRMGTALFFTMIGMALGGWLAGALYDLTGGYTISFLAAIAFNAGNLAIAVTLLRRARRPAQIQGAPV